MVNTMEEWQKQQEQKLRRLAKSMRLTVICAVGLALAWSAGAIWWGLSQEPAFNRAVHGHMVNAYYSNTPETMIANLQKAKDGMVHLGLTPEMYSTNYPWHKTHDNRMDWEYNHLDQIIARAKDVQVWRDNASHQAGTQANDIYEQKMDNLRAFIKEDGWSDDIAHDAWSANFHSVYWWWTSWPIVLPGIGLIITRCISTLVRFAMWA